MEKDELETSFRKGGAEPVLREKMGEYDLYFADGFSNPPHLSMQRFGVEPGEFPEGMFATLWWLGRGEKLHLGSALFFETTETSRPARINAARKQAAEAIRHLRKH